MAQELRESLQRKVYPLWKALAQLCAAHVARSEDIRGVSRRVQNLLKCSNASKKKIEESSHWNFFYDQNFFYKYLI